MSKKYIHAIHSVKGGSGKSSFSFALATKLSSKNVLLIDLDIRGTSLKSCFAKGDNNIPIYIEDKENKTFNDLIEASYIDWDDYVYKCTYQKKFEEVIVDENNGLTQKNNIDILFSSLDYNDKRKYLYNSDGNNTQKISVERFNDRFKVIVNNLKNDSYKEYEHIIFDMSPSSDEYTESMIETFKSLDESMEFIHYIIVTDDSAHMKATEEYLKDLTNGSIRHMQNEKIVVVFNQTYPDSLFPNGENSNDFYKKKIEIFKDNLSNIMTINKSKLEEINFLYCKFNEFYFHYVRDNKVNTTRNFEDFNIFQYNVDRNELVEYSNDKFFKYKEK